MDLVTIITGPQPVASPLTWAVPGGNYRAQGVWVRYTNGGRQVTPIAEADLSAVGQRVSPGGNYQATLTVEAIGEEDVPLVSITVTLIVTEQLHRNYPPAIGRNW